MTNLRAPRTIAAPVAARMIFPARELRSIKLRTGQDVVTVRVVTPAIGDLAVFV
jgi:hypothetical protein